eukprot:6461445-Prymnesium_polylepis.1
MLFRAGGNISSYLEDLQDYIQDYEPYNLWSHYARYTLATPVPAIFGYMYTYTGRLICVYSTARGPAVSVA